MNDVTVKKADLIAKVSANRAKHRAIFEEAVEGYRIKVVAILEDHIEQIEQGHVQRVYVSLPEPSDHTGDYDRVLAMLDMSIDDDIEIDDVSFGKYVMDDWTWKNEFIGTNAMYSETAAASLTA